MGMYNSPIELLVTDIQHQIVKQQDEEIYQAVLHYVPNVDKEELLRALRYDRDQYEKGYADGNRDATESVVHCCDCRNCTVLIRQVDDEPLHFCEHWKGHPMVDPTDYCSKGERRTDHENP